MNTTENEIQSNDATTFARVDQRLEALVVPVSNVDRAKQFYGNLGWRLDADFSFDNGFRVVQFTPPGSGCSVQFGTNITSAAPGSAQGLYLIVYDIEIAHSALVHCRSAGRKKRPQAPICPSSRSRVLQRNADNQSLARGPFPPGSSCKRQRSRLMPADAS
jgi:hypothetical protein